MLRPPHKNERASTVNCPHCDLPGYHPHVDYCIRALRDAIRREKELQGSTIHDERMVAHGVR